VMYVMSCLNQLMICRRAAAITIQLERNCTSLLTSSMSMVFLIILNFTLLFPGLTQRKGGVYGTC
jgi:hypothetical protein